MNRNLRIGIFTAVGAVLIVGFSVYVNDHPFWYRPCNEVKIHVDDATGLRRKSPVKTLGLDIGYINEVTLDGERVLVNVCVTGNVKLNVDTRAYIRSAGFLGDKFLELKPVDRADGGAFAPPSLTSTGTGTGTSTNTTGDSNNGTGNDDRQPSSVTIPLGHENTESRAPDSLPDSNDNLMGEILNGALDLVSTKAYGAERGDQTPTLNASREAELQDTMRKVGKLIDQLALMVGDLREVTQQKEFKDTVVNLNSAMKHLETLLRPNGKVMKNVDEAMQSLRNSMADAESVMKKIKEGEGSLGKFVNDPSIYDELRGAIQSVNLLLGKAGALKVFVDMSAWQVPSYNGAKARFSVMIAPNPGRYYLLGITTDPRGRDHKTVTTTIVNNGPPTVEVRNVNEEKGLRITAMFGKYFGPLDLRVGILEDNGAVAAGYWFDEARRIGIHAEVFSPGKNSPISFRTYARAQLFSGLYVIGGLDNNHKYYNPDTQKDRLPYFVGAGLFFDDDDLKYLISLL